MTMRKASAHSEDESAPVGAGLSRDCGQNVVHAASEDQCGSRPAPMWALCGKHINKGGPLVSSVLPRIGMGLYGPAYQVVTLSFGCGSWHDNTARVWKSG